MVALPVWVGTLISAYRLDPQQGGAIVTLFLAGAVLASVVFAPRFNRISGRLAATLGFGGATLAFAGASLTSDFATLAALHALARCQAAGWSTGVTAVPPQLRKQACSSARGLQLPGSRYAKEIERMRERGARPPHVQVHRAPAGPGGAIDVALLIVDEDTVARRDTQ
jgi:hypothetical protein